MTAMPTGADAVVATGGRRLLVIHNPTAGQRRAAFLAATLGQLSAAGCTVEVVATSGPGDATARARAARERRGVIDAVVAAGGDGTINEVANGLLGGELPLAILPLGTANVLAAEIGLAVRPDRVADAIARGRPRPVRVARLRSPSGERHLLLMAGAGFDAHVVRGVDPRLKRLAGKFAYVIEAARQMGTFGFPAYRVTVDGVAFEAASVIVSKGRLYGGPHVLAPHARLDAPSLEVCLFGGRRRLDVLRYGAALGLGRLDRLADVRIITGRRIEIDGPLGDPVQGDGDLVATLPVRIDVADAALPLIGPVA
jgi:YegS/Rv2252/BmrU family lipid kinase